MLNESEYDEEKLAFLVNGFKNGFSLQYEGPRNIQKRSPNLKFRIGDEVTLWNKVMGEVKEFRYAGPYKKPPFKNFIQSPIGLVEKDGGQKTRLIFHLSYPRDTDKSVNHNTPKELCSVKYPDFDMAIKMCLLEGIGCHLVRSDVTSAFRHLPIRIQDWCLLVMKAKNPRDGKTYYFVDKCLPFGHTISCALFQKVSDAISHIVQYRVRRQNVNYLDDFLFVALIKNTCDQQVQVFIQVCNKISMPVAAGKTFWGTTRLVFLGLLIDSLLQIVCIPTEKLDNLIRTLTRLLKRRSKKLTLRELQSLCGHLNFMCRSVVPGRAFLRRLYFGTKGIKKPNHHIYIKKEMKEDMLLWLEFLTNSTPYARPFIDFTTKLQANDIDFYADASKNAKFGAGGHCGPAWYVLRWNEQFIKDNNPSISYLELYATTVGVVLYIEKFRNQRIVLHSDNMGVVYMLNKNTSKCPNCMVLIRIIVLFSLKFNVRIFAKHVKTKANKIADSLSRQQWTRFRNLSKTKPLNKFPDRIPEQLWPMTKIYITTK